VTPTTSQTSSQTVTSSQTADEDADADAEPVADHEPHADAVSDRDRYADCDSNTQRVWNAKPVDNSEHFGQCFADAVEVDDTDADAIVDAQSDAEPYAVSVFSGVAAV